MQQYCTFRHMYMYQIICNMFLFIRFSTCVDSTRNTDSTAADSTKNPALQCAAHDPVLNGMSKWLSTL